MGDERLSREDLKAIEGAAKVVNGRGRVSGEVVREWMESECREVRTYAMNILVDYRGRVDGVPADADEFCLSMLEGFVLEDIRDDDWLPNRWEAARMLGVLFRHHWKQRPQDRKALAKIKRLMGRLIKTGEAVKEAILLGALEHMWTDVEQGEFFGDWERDAKLAGVYRDGLELAKGFREMGETGW